MNENVNPQINESLARIAAKVKAITKDRKNKDQNYNFRGIDDAYNELHDLFAAEGVIIIPKFKQSFREERQTRSGGTLIYSIATYEFDFVARDGSRETIILQGEGMDTGDKSLNKAFSAALKYALLSMFLIPTDEPKDSENESPAPLQKKKQPAPTPLTDTAKMPVGEKAFNQLCDRLKANSDPVERGNLLAKTRRYYLPFTDQQEEIIKQITDNL